MTVLPETDDTSDFLVHFTKGQDAYHSILQILGSGCIEARNPFGWARQVAGLEPGQHSACFSESPPGMLKRLADHRRSGFAVGFRKRTLVPQGAGRVWYIDQGVPQRDAIRQMVDAALAGDVNPADPIWKVTPFLDMITRERDFVWEREWRIPGGLSFVPSDVAFLVVPERLHAAAALFLESGGEGNGPAYSCPLVDAQWSVDRARAAISG